MTDPNTPAHHRLRGMVRAQLDVNWPTYAEHHPHLAAAVDRTTLIESAVQRLADDPDYQAAMKAAGRDEAVLDAAAKLVNLIERTVRNALAIK